MTLDEGTPAPAVSAPNQDGENISVAFDDPTVLYFYPKDDTPGCTIEANQFDAELDSFRAAGVQIYGVSTDDVDTHADFATDQGLDFDLLADPERDIAGRYEIPTAFGGANARTTVVVVDGDIWAVYEGVDPDGHAREVLEDLIEAGVVDLD